MQEKSCYDPLKNKLPKGAVTKGASVAFFVQTGGEANDAYLMIKNDTEQDYFYKKMEKVEDGFFVSHTFDSAGHFWYNFKIITAQGDRFVSKTYDTRSYVSNEKGEDFLQLVTENDYKKSVLEGGMIYQIFVDRFAREGVVKERKPLFLRDDWGGDLHKNTTDPLAINLETFGGNFKGITSKLDYLSSLGVTAIYLSPISMANSNHKYDTADYLKPDDMFGSEQDLKNLVTSAKEKGISIIIDGVYNHTGSDSIYFNKFKNFDSLGAFNSKESKYFDWFDFANYPNEYACWWGINTLPKIKTNCVAFQDFIAGKGGVIEKYMRLGVAGVRLDVVDEISDAFVSKIEKKVHEFGSDKIVMGEVWEDASTKISYSTRRKYFVNNELGSTMNYPIKDSIFSFLRSKNAFNLTSSLRMIENAYPKSVRDSLMNFLSTHDTSRAYEEMLSISGNNKELADKLFKLATALIFTLPGVPSIFYGDEYGMENNAGSSRGCFDWKKTETDKVKWIKKLAKLRKISAIQNGELEILEDKNGKFVFERFDDASHVVVLLNRSESVLHIDIEGNFVSFLSGKKGEHFKLKENEVEILIEQKGENK